MLEELKCRAEGAQAMASVALDATQRAAHAAVGVPGERRGVGVGLQVALARRESHHRGRQHVGLAKILVSELPGTLGALRAGRISQWRATLIAREIACLSRQHRAQVDHWLTTTTDSTDADGTGVDGTGADAAGTGVDGTDTTTDPDAGVGGGLCGWGEGELVGRLRAAAYRLDPGAVVARWGYAHGQRGVWLRPAPDTMTYLTALLPVTAGVGVYAALTHAANTARAGGDPRSRGQVMADLLSTRVLGHPEAHPPRVPVTVNVVVSDQVLLTTSGTSGTPDTGGTGTPDGVDALGAGGGAYLSGYGPIPPDLARQLATSGLDTGAGAPVGAKARVGLRRLYARPRDGALVGMDSTARCFPAGLAQLIRFRDRTCRTPWCDAPIRHIDHTQPADTGGPTTLTNEQGLCEGCNLAKQAPGHTQRVVTAHPHQVLTTTPTGHTYHSTAPPGPRPANLTPTAPADTEPPAGDPSRRPRRARVRARPTRTRARPPVAARRPASRATDRPSRPVLSAVPDEGPGRPPD